MNTWQPVMINPRHISVNAYQLLRKPAILLRLLPGLESPSYFFVACIALCVLQR